MMLKTKKSHHRRDHVIFASSSSSSSHLSSPHLARLKLRCESNPLCTHSLHRQTRAQNSCSTEGPSTVILFVLSGKDQCSKEAMW